MSRVTSGNAIILPEILRRVVDTYCPIRVYLFGSEARGDASTNSDIDLAVIVRDDAGLEQSSPRAAAEALWGLERGADVVVFKESEFAALDDPARRAIALWTLNRRSFALSRSEAGYCAPQKIFAPAVTT
jgi:predicted nucleotidyltransferase